MGEREGGWEVGREEGREEGRRESEGTSICTYVRTVLLLTGQVTGWSAMVVSLGVPMACYIYLGNVRFKLQCVCCM